MIDSSVRRFGLFKLIFAREELRQRDFLLAHRRDEEQVELSDVIDSDSRGAVGRGSNRGKVNRKSECVVEFLPTRDQFQRQMTVLELLVVRAVEIALFELRLLPLFEQLGKVCELRVDQCAARQVCGKTVGVPVGASRSCVDDECDADEDQ